LSAGEPPPLPERVEVAPDVVFRQVSGEAVILDLGSERYYGLDETGTRMWVLLAEHGSLAGVRERLLAEYEVAPEDLERDLAELVRRLIDEGLLRAAD
jgi:hypothetical protein